MYRSLVSQVRKRQKKSKPSESQNLWFTLPREIRDEIYREVLCKNYLIHWPARWKRGKAIFNDDRPLFWFRGRHYSWRGVFWSGYIGMIKKQLFWADIALLLTSKAISQEAMEIMYEGSSFCVYVGQRARRWYPMTPLPPQQVLDRIQNIEMGTCVCNAKDDYTASETWLKSFNGSHTKRNTCRISFPCYYCLVWCDDHSSFFRACQYLVGFKTVTVTLELLCADADSEEELWEIYNSMREDFKAALEPHLGPGRSYNFGIMFCLEFHPRKHLENVQSALPTSGSQALVP